MALIGENITHVERSTISPTAIRTLGAIAASHNSPLPRRDKDPFLMHLSKEVRRGGSGSDPTLRLHGIITSYLTTEALDGYTTRWPRGGQPLPRHLVQNRINLMRTAFTEPLAHPDHYPGFDATTEYETFAAKHLGHAVEARSTYPQVDIAVSLRETLVEDRERNRNTELVTDVLGVVDELTIAYGGAAQQAKEHLKEVMQMRRNWRDNPYAPKV